MEMMKEIGFEDCDKCHTPVELHLPCRDPIKHLLSMANQHNRSFNWVSKLNVGRDSTRTTRAGTLEQHAAQGVQFPREVCRV